MNVSWKWLLEYVRFGGSLDEAVRRMTMAGLNVDSVEPLADGDALLDVEVGSNRPDCLGHLGVARELAAITGAEFVVPSADFQEGAEDVCGLASVEVADAQGCPRYTARVLRNVKVGPSPQWLVRRIEAIGLRPVNNVVDVTNFILYEHGQPLHAFDYDRLSEHRIVVRRARDGELFEAIDHSRHTMTAGDLVIADARRPVAMAGVMGGLDTEVTERTVHVLLESAKFDPLSVRTTSRRTQLMSDSSYRFERGVDYDGVDWASRRACRLILETAGGTAARGMIDVRTEPSRPSAIRFGFGLIRRVLGIDVPRGESLRILRALGIEVLGEDGETVEVLPPAFRRDLTRDIDLVEEIARVYGYDKVPYLKHVPTAAPVTTRREEVRHAIESTLTAAGYQEAITITLTDAESASMFSPGDDTAPLATRGTALAAATFVRKSVLPGLLQAKRNNQDAGRGEVAMFEVARAFRDRPGQAMPHEAVHLALLTDDEPEDGCGVLETLASRLGLQGRIERRPTARVAELDAQWQADLVFDGAVIGFCGLLGDGVCKRLKFRHAPWVAEIELEPLVTAAQLTPRYRPVPQLPAIERDLALIVDEGVPWRDMDAAARGAGASQLEDVQYVSLYRGKPIPTGRKCIALRLRFRDQESTLTHEQADAFQERILAAFREKLAAELRAAGQ
ncbi:MAG: phenylalanine--tRNA ligase subunit beta [Phycisphaerae bacterium]|nr:phenylalanine--tRNA ligase subunit beta [Phycisphaerae bacterium]